MKDFFRFLYTGRGWLAKGFLIGVIAWDSALFFRADYITFIFAMAGLFAGSGTVFLLSAYRTRPIKGKCPGCGLEMIIPHEWKNSLKICCHCFTVMWPAGRKIKEVTEEQWKDLESRAPGIRQATHIFIKTQQESRGFIGVKEEQKN